MYVVYTSLQATYACENGPITTLGSAYQKKTIEYSSRFLAYGTLSSPDQRCDENVVVDGFHTIDFSNLFYHPITISTTSKAGCPPYVNPRLSMPAELTDVDAAWKTCQPLHYGAFDPPRVLTKIHGPLSPVPDKSNPTPVSAAEPVLTSSEPTSSVPIPATQAPHIPVIPSPTSNVQAATPSSSPGANDPANLSPSTLPAASPSQAAAQQPNVVLPVQPQTPKDPNSVLAGQASIAVPAEIVPGSSHQSTSPKPESASAQTTGLPQIVPVAVLPSNIAVSAQGSNPIVVLPKGVVGQLGDSPGTQPQPGNSVSGETQTGANPDGQEATSGGNPTANNPPILVDPKANSAPIIVALPKAQPAGSPGSGVVDSDDRNASSALPNGHAETPSEPGASAKAGSQIQFPNLASPILFGLSGPTLAIHSSVSGNGGDADGSINPNGVVNLGGTGSSSGAGDANGAANVDPASPQSESMQLAVLQAPTPLAIGTHPVALAPHGAVVVASQTISPGQQAAIDGTSISVGTNGLVIGGTTHSVAHPTAPEAVESTIYAPTTQIHTLAAGAETTINGLATTNTQASAVIVPETTNVPISTAFAPSENQAQDPANIVYSTTIRKITLQPGASATLENNIITTNTASTPLVLSQTSSIPVSTLLPDSPSPHILYSPSPITTTIPPGSVFTVSGEVATNTASTLLVLSQTSRIPVSTLLPDSPSPSTLYSPSPITTTIPPGSLFTVSGRVATNSASTPMILTEETNIPISTITNLSPSSSQDQPQIFEINGQLLTQTEGVYALSKLSFPTNTATASGGQNQDQALTLEILDGSTTSSTVVTVPAALASQLQISSVRGNSSRLAGAKSMAAATTTSTASFVSTNTTATATDLTGLSRTSAVQSTDINHLQSPIDSGARAMHTPPRLILALWIAASCIYVCTASFVSTSTTATATDSAGLSRTSAVQSTDISRVQVPIESGAGAMHTPGRAMLVLGIAASCMGFVLGFLGI